MAASAPDSAAKPTVLAETAPAPTPVAAAQFESTSAAQKATSNASTRSGSPSGSSSTSASDAAAALKRRGGYHGGGAQRAYPLPPGAIAPRQSHATRAADAHGWAESPQRRKQQVQRDFPESPQRRKQHAQQQDFANSPQRRKQHMQKDGAESPQRRKQQQHLQFQDVEGSPQRRKQHVQQDGERRKQQFPSQDFTSQSASPQRRKQPAQHGSLSESPQRRQPAALLGTSPINRGRGGDASQRSPMMPPGALHPFGFALAPPMQPNIMAPTSPSVSPVRGSGGGGFVLTATSPTNRQAVGFGDASHRMPMAPTSPAGAATCASPQLGGPYLSTGVTPTSPQSGGTDVAAMQAWLLGVPTSVAGAVPPQQLEAILKAASAETYED
eukprot:TRINITY_DN27047_c0_g3_i1.p1 TRINITY_DN27047_c0_g3~~TRINITY_DN27047_c0_g3_i1.p1  ORF type:complete len:427 (-),score=64.26 TRINITY_DN27047_c0_g3_i1:149-1300(-)